MAYSELIKNLSTIRTYIRSFYIYGFHSRGDFSAKSPRTYDDEKRRLENYLSGYMAFRLDENGKVSFVSIDSRRTVHNPLYRIFKAKSFTDMDISLHFILLDVLSQEKSLTIPQILDEISTTYLDGFSPALLPEESTLRKKLAEYVSLGLITAHKCGKSLRYERAGDIARGGLFDALHFFSEIAPCGAAGSFLLDTCPEKDDADVLRFKHHYITASIESDFLETAFTAIREHRFLLIEQKRSENARMVQNEIVPMMIFSSVQSGRMYLMAYRLRGKYFLALRFDYIVSMKLGGIYAGFSQKRAEFEGLRKNMFGVSLKQNKRRNDTQTEHITFRVVFGGGEAFVYHRLLREKRCGSVTLLDENTAQFDADVFDVQEIIPWARTFISRITLFDCTDKSAVRRFYRDIRAMSRLYEDDEDGASND